MEPTVVVAIVAAVVVAGLVGMRLRRVASRNRPDPGSPSIADDETPQISTADQRFRLLSFQGGSVPGDLQPMLEELRRNGIEVDEETLRRKLAKGAVDGSAVDGPATPEGARPPDTRPVSGVSDASATATVVEVTDVPVGNPMPGRMAVRVTLELRPRDGGPIREHVVAVVAEDTRALLVEGAEVPIRTDPDDPSIITLAWALA
jgi:hypothetical protein